MYIWKDPLPYLYQDAAAQAETEQRRGDGKGDKRLPMGNGKQPDHYDFKAENRCRKKKDGKGKGHFFSDLAVERNGLR